MLLAGLFFLFVWSEAIAQEREPERVSRRSRERAPERVPRRMRLEVSADVAFIKGDYERAMRTYERAWSRTSDMDENKDMLALKMARLYILLQRTEDAIRCYGQVYRSVDTLLTIGDVCYYVDVLRRSGQAQDAEVVARHYAFLRPYSRNQRYLNALNSLSNQQYYYDKGDADYTVEMLECSGPLAEYWMGDWKEKTFYAESQSSLQDPQKIFYHRTRFLALQDQKPEVFKDIPRELQSGPLAVSPDGKTMIATGIDYRSGDRIMAPGMDKSVYISQLHYSIHDARCDGWSSFRPLFPDQEGYSYAHPVFFNAGKSLLFSSDRAGGYGGMDLYICHWQDSTSSWGDPINMGPEVNTDGDEIFPRIVGDALFFASNGLEGYGGYDIYRISFGRNLVMPGTLFHYPYPVNTVYNDFGIFFDGKDGYFISDRRGAEGKDDIYSFDATVSPLSSSSVVGVSAEYSAMVGNLNLITGLSTGTTTVMQDMHFRDTPPILLAESGQLLMRVYFEFNSSRLDDEACQQLLKLIAEAGFNDLEEVEVIGYADEIGSPEYNRQLSQQRADVVTQYLKKHGATLTLTPEGRGQVQVPIGEQNFIPDSLSVNISELVSVRRPLSREERIRAFSKARRVEIVVRKKSGENPKK